MSALIFLDIMTHSELQVRRSICWYAFLNVKNSDCDNIVLCSCTLSDNYCLFNVVCT
jgi:hypothetical protein